MKRLFLLSSLLVSVLSTQAQVTPKVQPETLVNGNQYVLVNKAQTATQYTSRTSWDGAFYFLSESESNYANHALTAVDNGDGTWSFTLAGGDAESPTTYYFGLPDGSPNANANMVDVVKWIPVPKDGNFYQLILGEGNNANALAQAENTPTGDLRLHLNNGSQYFVATYYSGPWYPDCVGGINEVENEAEGTVSFAANDSTSFHWGFVSVEKIPAYMADIQYSATINKYYADYCDIDEYKDGFLATYNAVAKAYNEATDADALLEANIPEQINAKVALYKEIEAAIALNEEGDAALTAAIAAAQKAFNEKTALSEVEAATTTLKNAETAYSMGSGDISSLGTNMSFEDLSAQGGSQTTSGSPAPYGWNVYINGSQLAAGTNAPFGWHGVNDDAEGEIMDGAVAFGIWNASIPTYEISQTITGLENGTYEITAGLMAGSNGSGSRLTTQRIFGNLNSTYYASDYEYAQDALDKSEVYDFAGNEILQTDREMRPVTVQAFVYDGTLTFGVRTDGNIAATGRTDVNGAGGDGWFKTDNFTIKKLGYVAEDAIKIYEHYVELLKDFDGEPMAAKVADKMSDSALGNLTADSKQEDIIAGILSAKDLVVEVDASVKAYEKLIAAIEQHWTYLDQYDNKLGAGEYGDAIGEAQEAYESGSAEDEAAVDAIIAGLNEALQACIQSDEINEGDDLTEYIKNASFEDLSAQGGSNSNGVSNAPAGWDLYVEGEKVASAADAGVSGWCAINSGDNLDIENIYGEPVSVQYTDGDHLWGIWSNAIPVIELSQTIKGLPAGQYTLTVDAVVQNDWAGDNLGMQRLFANEYVTMYGAEEDYVQNADEELYATFPEDVLVAAEIDKIAADAEVKHLNYAGNYVHEGYGASGAPYTTTLVFGLAEKGDVTFGFRSSRISAVDGQLSSQASLGWFKLDNFTLTYDSAEVPAGAETKGEATAIDKVQTAEQGAVEFYSINGIRLAAPQKGINLVKMPNGKVNKVLVK
ncbi:MAG: hypothetical protein IJ693_00575 [Bacteroidaceae bacterium]|nr:hypothetical protein [Bacteroidaceae bacterium]